MQNERTKATATTGTITQPAPDKDRKASKGDVKHVVDTGLPPGIHPGQARDPGSNANDTGPADNRS